MSGMTLKQFARSEFYAALEQYKTALTTGNGLVAASLRVHIAKARVPRQTQRLVGRTFRDAQSIRKESGVKDQAI